MWSYHTDYDKKRIKLRQSKSESDEGKRKRGAPKGHKGHSKAVPEPDEVICVPRTECPEHGGESIEESDKTAEFITVDLVFTECSIQKKITKYMGKKSYCRKCRRHYAPSEIGLGYLVYGHGFRAWVIYHRLFLRLPYRVITQALLDQFNEKMCEATIINFLRYFADYHSETEQLLVRNILRNSFIHVDETKINIQGIEQYVWVFTDGSHVVFRLTETRQAVIVHEVLANYDGVLISDFYPGYDAVQCKQQKCWGHLIGDLNDDLWKAPFDSEFEIFVLEIRNLVLPIFETVEQYGLEKRHLGVFRESIEQFYQGVIAKKNYRSELTLKYQKRFVRYRESLFTFLEHDGIPWNNNMVERALRQLAVQRKISGTFFQSVARHFLLLLGIMQTCRLQNKSFLRFLLSGEKDIDQFE
jgi:transposase